MEKILFVFFSAALVMTWCLQVGGPASATASRPAPEFPSQEAGRWINSKPLQMTGNGENGLRGKVVLLNVWTFM